MWGDWVAGKMKTIKRKALFPKVALCTSLRLSSVELRALALVRVCELDRLVISEVSF